MEITVQFSGGLELLFKNQKEYKVTLPSQETKWTIEGLISWLKDNLLQEREELFLQGKTVRPGILILINDSDWELLEDGNLY